MLKYRKDGVSVIVVLDRRRMKNSGLFPVKIEVVYRRHQRYIPTWVDMSEKEWAKVTESNRCRKKLPEIERAFSRVREAVDGIVSSGTFSYRKLMLSMGTDDIPTVNASLRLMMERLLGAGKVNSYYRCRSSLLNIERFAGEDLRFRDITKQWLQNCEDHWLGEGKSLTTVNIYMNTLKSVLYEAMRKGYIREADFPFGRTGYKAPKPRSRKLALNKQQIKRIMEYRGPVKVEMFRDLWLFSYLCNGINFKDMLSLKYVSISDGEICFVRSKTMYAYGRSKVIKAVICPEMDDIIRRWGNPRDGNPETFIFPFLTGTEDTIGAESTVRQVISRCNAALKRIASDLGIPPFTTYSARHSFATVMQRSGVAVSFISESLGHSSLAVTESYLAGFDRETRLRNAAVLTDFA